MPPTQTRHDKQADNTGADLDEIMTMLGGPAALKLPTFVAFRKRATAVVRRDNEPNVIDGYKSRHGSTDGGGNSELTAVERAAFRLVETGHPADLVHAKAELIVANVRRIRDGLVHVDNAVRLVPTGAPDRDVLEGNDPTWCRSCLRFKVLSPRSGKNACCGWCRDFGAEYGIDPPEALVAMHAEGRRLSEADYARHVPAHLRKTKTAINWAHGAKTSARLVDDLPPSVRA